ncbi:transforming growth factor-beta receptor-associated protein 1-like [Oscarella lobularis]|uniref:transforming growth factor-beta receptor-associated protein 1-like n=1 Tax=Oscarella lobularis TaxID=121494 RepID=UPI0033134E04
MAFKAFEIVPVVEDFFSDKPKTAIECLECDEDNLYIGTSDCVIVHYRLKEGTSPVSGRITFQCQQLNRRGLGSKKPVSQLILASLLSRLFVLSDGTVFLLKIQGLQLVDPGVKLKNVSAMCHNESIDSSTQTKFEICIAYTRRKLVTIYTLTEERLIALRDIPFPDVVVTMIRDGPDICAALPSDYCLVDITTNRKIDICSYESETTRPVVKRITMGEFLIRQGELGLFVNESGQAKYQPLNWSSLDVRYTAYSFPYVLALSATNVTVYSVLDQERKQSILFQGGKVLGDFGERVLVASDKRVYALCSIPFSKQVQSLFSQMKIAEGLQLAKVGFGLSLDEAQQRQKIQEVEQQAGFAYLSAGDFDSAAKHLREGDVDVRELVALYPKLLPRKFKFTSSLYEDKNHLISDIESIVKGNPAMEAKANEFLMNYLADIRLKPAAYGRREIVDTVLLKLYANLNSPHLHQLIASENCCAIDESIAYLKDAKQHHAVALMHCSNNDAKSALDTWKSIVDGELTDESFPGFSYIVEFLSSYGEHETVLQYADWALRKDQEEAVKIFTDRPHRETPHPKLSPESVLKFLQPYNTALKLFLQNLIFNKKVEDERLHTQLALLYLDDVLALKADQSSTREKILAARYQLKHLLECSSRYQVSSLLDRIRGTDLHAECAVLYGKMGEHKKALNLLVHKLQDYHQAERYCVLNSQGKDRTFQRHLFQELLKAYLQPTESAVPLVAPAVDLLNSHMAEFDAVQVLELIPDTWSVGLVSTFLTRSLRLSLSRCRTTKIEHGLARGERVQQHDVHRYSTAKAISVGEDRLCQVCRRPFNDATVVCYPNGVVTHLHCGRNKEVCPVTGKQFGSSKRS